MNNSQSKFQCLTLFCSRVIRLYFIVYIYILYFYALFNVLSCFVLELLGFILYIYILYIYALLRTLIKAEQTIEET